MDIWFIGCEKGQTRWHTLKDTEGHAHAVSSMRGSDVVGPFPSQEEAYFIAAMFSKYSMRVGTNLVQVPNVASAESEMVMVKHYDVEQEYIVTPATTDTDSITQLQDHIMNEASDGNVEILGVTYEWQLINEEESDDSWVECEYPVGEPVQNA